MVQPNGLDSTFIFFMPIYWQLRGSLTAQAGLLLTSQAICTAIGGLCVGLLTRQTERYWYINFIFLVLFISNFGEISSLTFEAPLLEPVCYVLLAGIGFGGFLTTSCVSLISAVSISQHAVITSANYAFRSTGSAIGIAVASTIFQHILTQQLGLRI